MIRALDHLHGRHVALKVGPCRRDCRRELLSEARLLLSLAPHPGLPLVREDFFVDDRTSSRWTGSRAPTSRRLLADRAAGARPGARARLPRHRPPRRSTHLHGHDPPVVHGDVKPANLILTAPAGSSSSTSGSRSTDDGVPAAGTAGYVAPEVAAGEPPTAASDVYSLATTAVTLLTGSPPRGEPPNGRCGLDAERRRGSKRNQARHCHRSLATSLLGRRARRAPSRRWGADLPDGRRHALHDRHRGLDGSLAGPSARDERRPGSPRRSRGPGRRGHGGGASSRWARATRPCRVFTGAAEAARAAADLVGGMTAEPWPDDIRVRVRVGMHTGEAEGGARSPRAYLRIAPPASVLWRSEGRFSSRKRPPGFWQPAFPTDSISSTWGLTDCADSITRRTCRAVGAAVAGGAITCRVPVSRPP